MKQLNRMKAEEYFDIIMKSKNLTSSIIIAYKELIVDMLNEFSIINNDLINEKDE